ncbi:serine protease family [Phytophthora cinnamomi]|uniref:serine protease family n=1 Tax=Phytophthora cinnamomi TaxID=4785 RepID=UPI003559B8B9|nr:serine protease family [Phytophthora cinnamomi]
MSFVNEKEVEGHCVGLTSGSFRVKAYGANSEFWQGYKLEGRLGSIGFCALLVYLILLAQALIVAGAHVISWGATQECFTGFSSVLTAMKVILNVNSPTFTKLYSFKSRNCRYWLKVLVSLQDMFTL